MSLFQLVKYQSLQILELTDENLVMFTASESVPAIAFLIEKNSDAL
jgi:hypothetical protein